jgi:hypothetical protein
VPRSDAAELIAHAQTRVIELAAGRAGEMVAFPRIAPLPSLNDRRESQNYASLFAVSEEAVGSFLKYAAAEARSLILEHRDVFDALREALFEAKTMTNEQIDVVVYRTLVRRDQAIEYARRKQMIEMQKGVREFERLIEKSSTARENSSAA